MPLIHPQDRRPVWRLDQETRVATAARRRLYRPRGKPLGLFLMLAVVAMSTALATFLSWAYVGWDPSGLFGSRGVDGLFWSVFWLMVYSRWLCIECIRAYQRYASESLRSRCCLVPSCSEYSVICLRKYGLVVAAIKTAARLRRCGAKKGFDYP